MSNNAGVGSKQGVQFQWIIESFVIFTRDFGVWIASGLFWGLSEILTLFVFSGTRLFSASYSHGNVLNSFVETVGPEMSLIYGIAVVTLRAFYGSSVFRMASRAARGEKLQVGDIFSGGKSMVDFLLYSVLFALLCSLGASLCGVGLLFVFGTFWPGFTLVAEGEPALSALLKTYQAMKWNAFSAGLLVFVFAIVLMLSAAPCLIGLFATIPMGIIMSALACRDILQEARYKTVDLSTIDVSVDSTSWPPRPKREPDSTDFPADDKL